MEKHRNKFLTIFSITGTFIIAGLSILSSSGFKKEIPVTTNLAYDVKAEVVPEDEKVDIVSPDEKVILTVKKGREINGVVTQAFYISSETDKNPLKIFEKETSAENLVSVPVNTFSPDNKYIFLKYEDAGKDRYIVLRTDGTDIKEGSKLVEIESLFSEAYPDFVIGDVTGWGSYSLLIVNTDTLEGKTGPSWWFDLSNLSFIRLSSRFN